MKPILLVYTLVAATTAQAQITLKPKAGVVWNRLRDFNAGEDYYQDYQDRVWGALGGVGISYTFKNDISLQAEVLYTGKNARYTVGPGGPGMVAVVDEFRFHYLEIPVSVQVPLGKRFYVGAGAYYAHLLSNEYSALPANRFSFYEGNTYTKNDYGVLGEAGLRFRFLEVSLRYELGLPMIQYWYDVPANDPEYGAREKNDLGRQRSLQLSVAVPIRLGRAR